MIETKIFCDLCGVKFPEDNRYWEQAPTQLAVSYGPPRQAGESFTKPHVCYDCVKAVQKGLAEIFEARAICRKESPKDPPQKN